MRSFFATDNSLASLVLRVAAGGLMVPFGLMKIGVIGEGTSLAGTIQTFSGMGLPAIIAILVTVAETIGAIALILGFCTRFCAASLAVVMAGAAYIMAGQGFFGGYALPFVFLAMYVSLVISGGGMLSVDRFIAKR